VTRLRERLKEAAAAQTAYEECKTERDALAAELADLYPGVVQQSPLNEHMEHPEGDVVFRHACQMVWRGLSRSSWARAIVPAGRGTG
jgi:hypothetical protein